jgi:DNA-binding response OmpR family regulator
MPKMILIVDDEPGIVVPVQFLMEQQGYNVITANRGDDALDLIYKYKPDLVLLDIMLPGIDGYEVCEIVRLSANYRNVKIAFLTAKSREVEIAKGLALGADSYITKPFSNDELVAKVKELLETTYEEAIE